MSGRRWKSSSKRIRISSLARWAVFDFHDGHWERPTGPGLGIEVDADVVEEMAKIGHDRKQPIWWHTDGSYAEF